MVLKLQRRTATILSWKFAAILKSFQNRKPFLEALDFATFHGKREDKRSKSEEHFLDFKKLSLAERSQCVLLNKTTLPKDEIYIMSRKKARARIQDSLTYSTEGKVIDRCQRVAKLIPAKLHFTGTERDGF